MNAYPNDENYESPSFVPPVPSPDVDPDTGDLITVAYNPAWTPVMEGALTQLLQYAAWEGTHDDKILAVNRAGLLMSALQREVFADMPAPWWDQESGDDADDEAPVETQPWYGELQIVDDELTFVENAFIWVVAGIIVYAGLPGAALSFVPIAQKFVVTVKKNPLGGIIRFLADAVEIGRVDTYSATDVATEVPVIMPSAGMGLLAEDAPVFWVELLEDNPHGLESVSMTVMRSRLSENDFSPTSLRYNSDCDCVQYSPDGGETWVDDPGDDPRTSTKFIKPLKTGSDIRCRSAASMVKWMRDFIEYEAGILTAGAEVVAVSNAAFALFDILAPWAVLVQLIIDAAGTLFGIGGAALTAAFGGDEWAALLCIFDCTISSSGLVTDDQMISIQAQISVQLNTTAALVLNLILSTQGVVGLTNAGTLYEVEEDCGDCDCGWGYEWDFLTSDGGFTPYVIDGLPFAEYVSGVGWRCGLLQDDGCSGHAYLYLRNSFPLNSVIETVQYDLNTSLGGLDANVLNRYNGSTYIDSVPFDNGDAITHTASMAGFACDNWAFITNKCGLGAKYDFVKVRCAGFGTMPAFTGGSEIPHF